MDVYIVIGEQKWINNKGHSHLINGYVLYYLNSFEKNPLCSFP